MRSAVLTVFGPATLREAGRRDRTPRSRKLLCLLAYLALHPQGRATRERICGLLWSDRGEEHARAALRQASLEMRREWSDWPEAILSFERETITLDLDMVEIDAREIDRLLATGESDDLPRAAALWRGTLLEGLSAPDRSFDEWMTIERAQRDGTLTRALATGLSAAEARQDDVDIIALADALLRHDPGHEQACRALMALDVRGGDVPAALRRFAAFQDRLARDLEANPSAELSRYAAGLARPAPGMPAWRRPLHDPLVSIASFPRVAIILRPPVGPVEIVTNLHALLAEELRLNLGRLRSFILLPGDFVEAKIAEADYTVIASLRHDGDSGTVTVRLIQNQTGGQVFSDQAKIPGFRPELAILAESERFSYAVAHAISMPSLPAEPEGGDAYELWAAGDRLVKTYAKEAVEAATALFLRASELDPNFAPPIGGLASAELSLPMSIPREGEYAARIERGLSSAKQAVALDPWNGRLRSILGWAFMRKRLGKLAAKEFQHALALAPNDPIVLMGATGGLTHLGEPAPAIPLGEKALRIHPAPLNYHYYSLSLAYQAAGAYDRALEFSLAAPMPVAEQLAFRSICYRNLGRDRDAAETAEQFLSHVRRSWSSESPPTPEAVLHWLDATLLTAARTTRRSLTSQLAPYLGVQPPVESDAA